MSLLEEHEKLDKLIRRRDYNGIDFGTLNEMYIQLDGDIDFMQYKLKRISKAIDNENDRLNEAENSNAWRNENTKVEG